MQCVVVGFVSDFRSSISWGCNLVVAGFVFDFLIWKDGGISKVRSGAAGNFVFLARSSIFGGCNLVVRGLIFDFRSSIFGL